MVLGRLILHLPLTPPTNTKEKDKCSLFIWLKVYCNLRTKDLKFSDLWGIIRSFESNRERPLHIRLTRPSLGLPVIYLGPGCPTRPCITILMCARVSLCREGKIGSILSRPFELKKKNEELLVLSIHRHIKPVNQDVTNYNVSDILR